MYLAIMMQQRGFILLALIVAVCTFGSFARSIEPFAKMVSWYTTPVHDFAQDPSYGKPSCL